jgi:hypothetical protein
MRHLGRQFVELQRAKQADGRVRHAHGDLGKGVQLGDRCIRKSIDSAVDLLQHPPLTQPTQVDPWDARVARSRARTGPLRASRRRASVLVVSAGMIRNVSPFLFGHTLCIAMEAVSQLDRPN